MPYEQHRGARLLGQPHEARRTLAHLADVARGAFELVGVGGLNRVDEHHLRVQGVRMVRDRLEPGFPQHVYGAGVERQPVRPQPHLIGRLLSRDVQRADAGVLEARRALQQQGGFSDAGLAPHQHDRTRHDAAAQHEVELAEARLPPLQTRPPAQGGQADRRTAGRGDAISVGSSA